MPKKQIGSLEARADAIDLAFEPKDTHVKYKDAYVGVIDVVDGDEVAFTPETDYFPFTADALELIAEKMRELEADNE